MSAKQRRNRTNLTVSSQLQITQDVVRVRLADIASIQIERGEADGSPEHDFPVDLAHLEKY